MQVEWLNDSACNAIFPDAAAAARALISMGTPLPPDAVVPEGSSEVPLSTAQLPGWAAQCRRCRHALAAAAMRVLAHLQRLYHGQAAAPPRCRAQRFK